MSPTALVTVPRRDTVAMLTVKVQYIANQSGDPEKEALINEHLVGCGTWQMCQGGRGLSQRGAFCTGRCVHQVLYS